MKITARFPGRCRECCEPFAEGDRVEWVAGAGATCLGCAGEGSADGAAPRAAAPADPGGVPFDPGVWAAIRGMTGRRPGAGGVRRADTQRPDAPPLARCAVHGWQFAPGTTCVGCDHGIPGSRGA